jgi:hypothetical protein
MWEVADALRQLVEDDPNSLDKVRSVLSPLEDEIWQEADAALEHPGQWNDVGASWGPRALHAMETCLA